MATQPKDFPEQFFAEASEKAQKIKEQVTERAEDLKESAARAGRSAAEKINEQREPAARALEGAAAKLREKRINEGECTMGQRPDEIERHIEEQRGELGDKIKELQHKVKRAFDWRVQFQQRPLAMMGVAFAGGFFLSTVIGGGQRHSVEDEDRWPGSGWPVGGRGSASHAERRGSPAVEHQKQKALETWDTIKGAFIGIAASKLKDFLDQSIPNFEEQYRNVERDKRESQISGPRMAAASTERTISRTGTGE